MEGFTPYCEELALNYLEQDKHIEARYTGDENVRWLRGLGLVGNGLVKPVEGIPGAFYVKNGGSYAGHYTDVIRHVRT